MTAQKVEELLIQNALFIFHLPSELPLLICLSLFISNNQLISIFLDFFYFQQTTINNKQFCATWSETGTVYVWDNTKGMESLDLPGVAQHQTAPNSTKHTFHFSGHQVKDLADAV